MDSIPTWKTYSWTTMYNQLLWAANSHKRLPIKNKKIHNQIITSGTSHKRTPLLEGCPILSTWHEWKDAVIEWTNASNWGDLKMLLLVMLAWDRMEYGSRVVQVVWMEKVLVHVNCRVDKCITLKTKGVTNAYTTVSITFYIKCSSMNQHRQKGI